MQLLTTLAAAPAPDVIRLANTVLPSLGRVDVLQNKTGIAMLPATDTVHGTVFHLGEVLIAVAHVRLSDHKIEGYGACIGRNTEQAMALALLDAALSAQIDVEAITEFATEKDMQQRQADAVLQRKVDSTRIEMETF